MGLRWVYSSEERVEGRDAQRSDSCIGGEQCGSRCVHFQKLDMLEFDGPTEDLLEVSSQVEKPRVWATYIGIPVIPTSWLNVIEDDVKRSEYRSSLCQQRAKRWDRTVPRMTVHSWENKWENVLIKTNFEVVIWSPETMCCRERQMCGFVHKDDFVEDSKEWAWRESQLNEKKTLKRTAVLGLTVAIPNQSWNR